MEIDSKSRLPNDKTLTTLTNELYPQNVSFLTYLGNSIVIKKLEKKDQLVEWVCGG